MKEGVEVSDEILPKLRASKYPEPKINQTEFDDIVQNQLYCGGCWAFATLLSLEKHAFNSLGSQFKFSPQHMVDCDYSNYGCSGGLPDASMKYISENGVAFESDYPYQGRENQCPENLQSFKFGTDLNPIVYKYKESIATQLTLQGNYIAIGIEADEKFTSIRYLSEFGEPYIPMNCGGRPNHAITIVDSNPEYFTIQNSWGPTWGYKGYLKIKPCDPNSEMFGLPSSLYSPVPLK